MKVTLSRARPVLATTTGVLLALTGSAGPASAARTGRPGPATYPVISGRFYHVAATSPSNAWAVGLEPSSSLIEHWNGRSWGLSFTEPVGYFYGVAATSTRNAWAVGGTNWFSPTQTLAEHWNGRSWRRVSTPSPHGGGYFTGVAATSRSNAWAVGLISPGGPGAGAFPPR